MLLASSVIAISVGVIELLGCAQDHIDGLDGPFWDAVAALNANFEYVGYFVIGFFAVSMLAALAAFACPLSFFCGDRCVASKVEVASSFV